MFPWNSEQKMKILKLRLRRKNMQCNYFFRNKNVEKLKLLCQILFKSVLGSARKSWTDRQTDSRYSFIYRFLCAEYESKDGSSSLHVIDIDREASTLAVATMEDINTYRFALLVTSRHRTVCRWFVGSHWCIHRTSRAQSRWRWAALGTHHRGLCWSRSCNLYSDRSERDSWDWPVLLSCCLHSHTPSLKRLYSIHCHKCIQSVNVHIISLGLPDGDLWQVRLTLNASRHLPVSNCPS